MFVNFNELNINLCYSESSIYLFIYLFIYLSIANAPMRRLVCAFVFFFLQTAPTLATVFRHMFHSVGQDESAHMHSLAIASTAGLYKMINFIH